MSRVTQHEAAVRSASLPRVLRGVIVLGALVTLVFRIYLAYEMPLWLDETWSAMIANQPDWISFWREAWLDCNPPLYYFFLTLWVSVFGDSNLAMRLPSFIFVVAAAIAPIVRRPRGLNETAAWTWGALILLWGPGIFVILDARGYGLLLLLSTLSCLIVSELHERLTMRSAAIWVALCALMFLTHYFAAMLIAGQALVLLQRHRLDLIKVWPAGLLAVPAIAWFAYHFPRLAEYARPDVVWYRNTTSADALGYFFYVMGGQIFVVLSLLAIIFLFALLQKVGDLKSTESSGLPSTNSLAAVALAGAIGLALAIIMGMYQPSLTNRYLVPLMPAAMLVWVLMTLKSAKQTLLSLLLVIIFLLPGLNFDLITRIANGRSLYGYEKGSDFLATHEPTRLLFIWDHPAAKILDRRSLAGIGEFFLKRHGLDVPTTALLVRETDDPNGILRSVADGKRPAIIWLYNTARRSAARLNPPMLQNDPAWECRSFRRPAEGTFALGAIACVRMDGSDA